MPSSISQPASANPFGTTATLDYHVWATDGSVYLIQTINQSTTEHETRRRRADSESQTSPRRCPGRSRRSRWYGNCFASARNHPEARRTDPLVLRLLAQG